MNEKLCSQFLHKRRSKDLSLKFPSHSRKSWDYQKNCNFEGCLQGIRVFISSERMCWGSRKLCLQTGSGWGYSTEVIAECMRRKETHRDCLIQPPCSKCGQIEQVVQNIVQSGLYISKKRDSTTSLCKLITLTGERDRQKDREVGKKKEKEKFSV